MFRSECLVTSPVENQKVKKLEPIIFIKNGVVTIEICDRCLTDCSYCYMKDRAKKDGLLVPYETIVTRLDWLQKFTNIKEITLLGGEVLLNPDFPKIVKEIQRRGLYVTITSSGVYNRRDAEQMVNAQFLVDEFANGGIGVVLSYHHGKNENMYADLFNRLRGVIPQRRASIAQKIQDLSTNPESVDLHDIYASVAKQVDFRTNVVLGRSLVGDEAKHQKIYEYILDLLGFNLDQKYKDKDLNLETTFRERVGQNYQALLKHYAPFKESKQYAWATNVDLRGKEKLKFTFYGSDEIIYTTDESGKIRKHIVRPMGTKEDKISCPAKGSGLDGENVSLSCLSIDTSGKATFPEPVCVSMNHGLIDLNNPNSGNHEFIRKSFLGRISQIKKIINVANHDGSSSAPDRPNRCQEPGDCPTCPLDIACDICHVIKPPEVKLIDPSTL